jgi:hypothetical protein
MKATIIGFALTVMMRKVMTIVEERGEGLPLQDPLGQAEVRLENPDLDQVRIEK